MFLRRVQGLSLALGLVLTGQAGAQPYHTPARGSQERAAILESVRPVVEKELRGPVEFVITAIRASSDWAFVHLEPQRPGGRAIDVQETDFADGADMMDGLTVYGLLQFENGQWNLVEHIVGPTDVAYLTWPDQYGVPPEILGLE